MNFSVKFFDPTLSVCAAAAPQSRQRASTMAALRASDLIFHPRMRGRKCSDAPLILQSAVRLRHFLRGSILRGDGARIFGRDMVADRTRSVVLSLGGLVTLLLANLPSATASEFVRFESARYQQT